MRAVRVYLAFFLLALVAGAAFFAFSNHADAAKFPQKENEVKNKDGVVIGVDYCPSPTFPEIQSAEEALALIEFGKNYSALTTPGTAPDGAKAEKPIVDDLLRTSTPARSPQGLVTCGRSCDDPTTKINEAAICTVQNLLDLPASIINTLIIVWMPLILAILIVYAGFLLMTAAGNPNRRKKGIAIIKWGVIGYAIMLSAWVIVSGALALLGVQAGLF